MALRAISSAETAKLMQRENAWQRKLAKHAETAFYVHPWIEDFIDGCGHIFGSDLTD